MGCRSAGTVSRWLRTGKVCRCPDAGCRNVSIASLRAFLASAGYRSRQDFGERRDHYPAVRASSSRARTAGVVRRRAHYDRQAVRWLFHRQGLSMQQVAGAAGVDRETVARVLSGRATESSVRRVCRALGLDPRAVFPREGGAPDPPAG